MSKEYKCNYCGKIVDKKTCVYSLDDNKKPFDIQCEDCYSKEKRGAILSTPQQGDWEVDLYDFYYKILKANAKEFDKKPPERNFLVVPVLENLKPFIRQLLQHEREELAGKIEGMKKQKTADRQLIHFDHKVEHIKYYENDSDPAFNEALSQVLNLIKPNTPPNAGD